MGFFRVLAAILLVVVTVGIAGAVFQAGYIAGAAGDVSAVAGGPWYGWHMFGWGLGGGLFSFLGTLLFLFLVIGLVRAAFGGGPRDRWGHGPRHGWGSSDSSGREHFGRWQDQAREIHDEWHSRSAGEASGTGADAGRGSTPGATSGTPTDPSAGRGA